jgi:hypothetical protein
MTVLNYTPYTIAIVDANGGIAHKYPPEIPGGRM